jgi:hypothetical protein
MPTKYHLRGDNQTQSGQKFKGTGPLGKKLRKLSGGETAELDVSSEDWPLHDCKPRNDTSPPMAKRPKGPYLDPNRFFVDGQRPIPIKPISKAAIDLLGDYLRRRAFEEAINDGAPVDFAGRALLGLSRTQTFNIQKSMPDGAYAWFEREHAFLLARGKIGQGRATERCQLADHFYIELSGGIQVWNSLRLTGGGLRKIIVKDELPDKDISLRESTSYGIWSRAFHNWKED